MHGLYLLWWVQEKQLSAALVAAVLAAGDLALVLLEVPTGWLADRFGHRISLIVGSFAQVAGMLWCWLGQGISGLIAACLLVALGDAFRSGADQALLYRTCVVLGCEHDFQRIEARTRAAQLAALVGLVCMGGAIVNRWGFAAGWTAEALLCTVGFALACAMREPPACRVDHNADVESGRKASARTLGIGVLIALILPTAFLGGAASVTSFLAQTAAHSDAIANTALVAVVSLAEAAGSMVATRIRGSARGTQIALTVLGGVTIAAAAVFPAAFLAVVVILAFLVGLAHPLRAAAIQNVVADHARARAASIASACDMAVNLIALPVAGVWRTRRRLLH
jgi:hypothetical protein